MGQLNLYLLLFLILFAWSCSKEYSGYKSTGDKTAVIAPFFSRIAEVDPVDWKVGPLGKYTVSKGIRLKIMFPRITLESIQDLSQKMEVDSWLVRVHKTSNYGSDILGYFYVPMIAPGSNVYSTNLRVRQIDYGMVNLYYAAAGHTPRFESLTCPPFNHQFLITDDDIEMESGNPLSKMMVGPGEYAYIGRQIDTFGYRPTTINAGTNLVGVYFVDIALFDSKNKMKRSSYLQLPDRVRVKLERTSPVPGCSGFEVKPKEPENDKSYKDFKFGR